MNVEHRTSNIERRIMISLRSIEFYNKTIKSIERLFLFFFIQNFVNKTKRSAFHIRRWTFDPPPPRLRRTSVRCWTLIFLVLAGLIGCSTTSSPPSSKPGQPKPYKINGIWYQPRSSAEGFRQRGLASWYGEKFHGRKTANGEKYDMYGVSAAHKTLPFNTYVRVHNLSNGKKLDVRINDRGPFVRGRIIDLSYTAAKKLGVAKPGTAKVEIVALGTVMQKKENEKSNPGSTAENRIDYTRGNFTFQVGAFLDRENAEKLRQKLDKKYKNAHIVEHSEDGQVFYRVRVGKFATLEDVKNGERTLLEDGYDPIIVAE